MIGYDTDLFVVSLAPSQSPGKPIPTAVSKQLIYWLKYFPRFGSQVDDIVKRCRRVAKWLSCTCYSVKKLVETSTFSILLSLSCHCGDSNINVFFSLVIKIRLLLVSLLQSCNERRLKLCPHLILSLSFSWLCLVIVAVK